MSRRVCEFKTITGLKKKPSTHLSNYHQLNCNKHQKPSALIRSLGEWENVT